MFDELNIFVSSVIVGGKDSPSIAGGKGFLKESKILSLERIMNPIPITEPNWRFWGRPSDPTLETSGGAR